MKILSPGCLVPLILLTQPFLRISASAVPPAPAEIPAGVRFEDPLNSSISVGVNASTVLDHPAGIKRISIANGDIAEAIAV
ncbi:MAG TPA: pilus assembly protein N-terminal domain-containing protein, partial [Bryobacteraceae bacterium]